MTTVGATFLSRIIEFPEQRIALKYDIWDTAGQEKYHGMIKLFYKDAIAIVLVYSIIHKHSYEALVNYWCKEVQRECPTDIILVVVANKSDLYVDEKVEEEEAKLFAKSINAQFFQASAKTKNGIESIFQYVGTKFLSPNGVPSSSSSSNQTAMGSDLNKKKLEDVNPNEKKEKKKCCQ